MSLNSYSIGFNGTSQNASVAFAMTGVGQPKSIECWTKIVDSVGTQTLIFKGTPGVGANFSMEYDSTSFFLNSDTGIAFNSGWIGSWVHFAWTYDGTSSGQKCYVNGVDTAFTTGPSDSNMQDGTSALLIGARAASQWFEGRVDEFRIWDDVRTQSEIVNNMRSQLVGTEPGLIAYYRFNNNLNATTGSNLTGAGSPTFNTDVPFSGETGNFLMFM